MFVPKRWHDFLTSYFVATRSGGASSFPWVEDDGTTRKRADAVLLTSSLARQYLLDFHSSAGTLLLFAEAQYFIIDFRYWEQAKAEITCCEVLLQDDLYQQVKQLLQQHGATCCGVEDQQVTLSQFLHLTQQLDPVEILPDSGGSRLLQQMRRCKDEQECRLIQQAQQITDEVFAQIRPLVCPGVTERELALEIEHRLKREGADGISFDTIVASGKNGSLPHAHPRDTVVQPGDFVTMDFGAMVGGYHADMTRTVAVGAVSAQQREVYHAVLEAQSRALAAIKPGVACAAIDQIARSYLGQAGYGAYFGHGLGHSVGLEIHESPSFSPHSDDTLEVGMVLTVEPGVYLPAQFGVRIEDLVIVTEQGCENLTQSSKQLNADE